MSSVPERPDTDVGHTWRFTSTLFLGFGILVLFVLCDVFVTYVVNNFISNSDSEFSRHLISTPSGYNGLYLGLATCFSAPVCSGAVVILILMCKGRSIRDYLQWVPVRYSTLLLWLCLIVIFLIFSELINSLAGRPPVNEFMESTYKTAYILPLFWFAIAVAAPLFEEIFFRGFLLTGFQNSFLRGYGAIVLTSFLWAVIHIQYDLYDISWIFLLGLLLGYARLSTGSILVPITMHVSVNLISLTYTAIYLSIEDSDFQTVMNILNHAV